MANDLIDNSEQFKLVKYIKELVSRPECNHIMIATGYWDLPGTALVYDELKDFFARGGKLDLLIGQEPQLQYYQASREAYQFPDELFYDEILQVDPKPSFSREEYKSFRIENINN